MQKLRVLVVDDSAFMRRIICNLLEEDPEIQVVGTAVDGFEAIHKVHELSPDVVTLDVEMPRLDGLQTLGYLMSECPVPCLMLSTFTHTGAEATLKALEYGAVDLVLKPSGVHSLNLEQIKEELHAKVKIARTIDLRRLHFRDGQPFKTAPQPSSSQVASCAAVAVGCSTGGPRALAEFLPALPRDLPASLLVVQHMSPGFTKSLADRLDKQTLIRVKEAEDGEPVLTGMAYLAPGDWHMEVERAGQGVRVRLNQRPPVQSVRPSADVLFQSVAESFRDKAVGVVLTGMGKDGVRGLKTLKQKKAKTLAQDEASCVVFGMPRAAWQAGAVDRMVPLKDMAQAVLDCLP